MSEPSLRDAAWLRQRYVRDGASLSHIAREVGCTQAAVRQALSRYGIPIREGGPRPVLADLSADEALALVREHSIGGAAESLGVSRATFTITLGRLEVLDKAVELSHVWRAEVMPRESWWPRELCDPALLADLYDRLSALQIGKLLGVHRTTVSAALDTHGIPRRSTNVRPPKAPARAVVGALDGEVTG